MDFELSFIANREKTIINKYFNILIEKRNRITVFVSVWTVELEEMNAFWAWNRVPTIDLLSIELHCGRSRQELEDDLRTSMTCFR